MKKVILNSRIKVISKSEASLGNPYINKVNFVLTDDKPNANGVGIKSEDFLDFASSSVFMPIKMSQGDILDHVGASPVGVITETEIFSDKILGAGVLWPEERPADVALIKEKTEKGQAQISWEVGYQDASLDDEGTMWLLGPKLLAATLVKYPSYEGRTPMTSFSSVEEEEEMTEIDETPQEPEELETDSEEVTEEIVEEAPEEVVEEPVDEVSEESDDTLTEDEMTELEELRTYKRKIERSKVVKDTLGDIEAGMVEVLIDLTDKQLQTVKKLVSSRKEEASKKEPLPARIPTQHKNISNAEVLKNFLGGNE